MDGSGGSGLSPGSGRPPTLPCGPDPSCRRTRWPPDQQPPAAGAHKRPDRRVLGAVSQSWAVVALRQAPALRLRPALLPRLAAGCLHRADFASVVDLAGPSGRAMQDHRTARERAGCAAGAVVLEDPERLRFGRGADHPRRRTIPGLGSGQPPKGPPSRPRLQAEQARAAAGLAPWGGRGRGQHQMARRLRSSPRRRARVAVIGGPPGHTRGPDCRYRALG